MTTITEPSGIPLQLEQLPEEIIDLITQKTAEEDHRDGGILSKVSQLFKRKANSHILNNLRIQFAILEKIQRKPELTAIEVETLPRDFFRKTLLQAPNQIIEYSRITSITALILSKLDLPYLPSELFNHLPKLQTLDLSDNQLKKLSKKFGNHWNDLEQLFLSHNFLTTLPSTLGTNCPKLRVLTISDNPISDIPFDEKDKAKKHLKEISQLPQQLLLVFG